MRRLLLLISLFLSSPANGELQVSLHGGLAATHASDVRAWQKDKLSLTLHGVEWKSEPLRGPPYWGARVVYWKDWMPASGFGLDFVHTKIIARDDQRVWVTGDRGGNTSVRGFEPLSGTVSGLSLTDGLNFLMLNLYERWRAKEAFRPHVGLGAGILLPHVEGKVGSAAGDGYHYGGLALQALGGLELTLAGRLSLFAEYKLHHAWLKLPYGADAGLSTRLWTHQLALGLSAAIETGWSQP